MAKRRIKYKRGGNGMMNKNYKSLDLTKLNSKKITIVSTEESLKDISPVNWSKDVLLGKKKVLINYSK